MNQLKHQPIRLWQLTELQLHPLGEAAHAHQLIRRGHEGARRQLSDLFQIDERRLALRVPEFIDHEPPRDRKRPGHDRSARCEVLARAVNVQERLLHQIFRLPAISSAAHQESLDARPEQIIQLGEGGVFPAGVAVHGRICARAEIWLRHRNATQRSTTQGV